MKRSRPLNFVCKEDIAMGIEMVAEGPSRISTTSKVAASVHWVHAPPHVGQATHVAYDFLFYVVGFMWSLCAQGGLQKTLTFT